MENVFARSRSPAEGRTNFRNLSCTAADRHLAGRADPRRSQRSLSSPRRLRDDRERGRTRRRRRLQDRADDAYHAEIVRPRRAVLWCDLRERGAPPPRRIVLGVETEIAVRLGEDLPQGGGRARVEAAVESCMAAIELLEDLRHDYKRLSAAAMVAGNVWNAGSCLAHR